MIETVQPTYDLFSHYIQTNLQIELSIFAGIQPETAAIVTGQQGLNSFHVPPPAGAFATIPQNQMWWIEAANCHSVSVATTDAITYMLGYELFGGSGFYALTAQSVDPGNTRARFINTPPLTRSQWLPPGAIFQIFVLDVLSAGGIQVLLDLRATAVPI
jgi:hypothetical protein